MYLRRLVQTAALLVLTFFIFGISAQAIEIAPELKEQLIAEGRLQEYIALHAEDHARGICSAEPRPLLKGLSAAKSDAVDTVRVLVLLVDFSDNPYTAGPVAATPGQFDSVLFSTGNLNPTGSMTEFYMENSYGTFFILGDVYGWYRMPQTYAYYVNGQRGFGSYPQNAQGLTVDAVLAADAAGVDFSLYDIFGPAGIPDGYVDGLFVVHAGPGYEETGDLNMIHSHKWNLGSFRQYLDNVWVDAYTQEPEESGISGTISPIGVFAHEYGHFIGFPDLYDIDGEPATSDGLGRWSLMASGSYNGGSRIPAHLDAWCKSYVGFVQPIEVVDNLVDVVIPQAETDPVVYKLWALGEYGGPEYFLVENRQLVGFDAALPGRGLFIYHVDDNKFGNFDPAHYHVALEQADGKFDLEYGPGSSDAGDPYPGTSGVRSFDDLSIPDSRSYNGITTEVSVWNISDPDSIMTANLDVHFSRPKFILDSSFFADAGGDNILDFGETVQFTFYLTNAWDDATGATITMTSTNPAIEFTPPSIYSPVISGSYAAFNNIGEPFVFTVPDAAEPVYDTFFITIESDAGAFVTTFDFEMILGKPEVLLVDDDRGVDYDLYYTGDLYQNGFPAHKWDKFAQGSPSAEALSNYEIVIWFTGDTFSDLIQPADIDAISAYLDGGGNLFLSGQTVAAELHEEDSLFLKNYLHARLGTPFFALIHLGQDGSPVAEGFRVRYVSYAHQSYAQATTIEPASGGIPAFSYQGGGYSAVSYAGAHKVVFFNWGYEDLSNTFANYTSRDTLLTRILTFFKSDSPEVCDCVPGEADGETEINLLDILYLIDKVYSGGPDPVPYSLCSGDANCDCAVNLLDILRLIDFLYMEEGGPPCSCESWIANCGALQ
ncbi:MAG: M6 family metalloprotease domain-containing protein [Candidatus Zixiibacteriota bacterium]|nr:MAG: M6 family metalloprotease domain-containing protein [candidate division Zixibacteria bacterium]